MTAFNLPERLTVDEIARRLATPPPPKPEPVDPDALMTPAEVARLFKCDAKTINRWGRKGLLTSIRTLGGHRRYYEAEVRALLDEGRQERER